MKAKRCYWKKKHITLLHISLEIQSNNWVELSRTIYNIYNALWFYLMCVYVCCYFSV